MEEILKVGVTPALRRVLQPGFDGDVAEIKLEGINFGQYKSCRRKSVVIKEHSGIAQQFRDTDLYEDLIAVASIRSCPFDKTIDNLHKLSLEDGHKLMEAVDRVNTPPKIEDESISKTGD